MSKKNPPVSLFRQESWDQPTKQSKSTRRRLSMLASVYLAICGLGFGLGVLTSKLLAEAAQHTALDAAMVDSVSDKTGTSTTGITGTQVQLQLPLELPTAFGGKQTKEGGELYMENNRVEDLYSIFGGVAKSLSSASAVKVWLDGETLLGEVRHRPSGPMRWSETLYMGAFKKDVDSVKSALTGNSELVVEDDDKNGRIKITAASPAYNNKDDKAILFLSLYSDDHSNGFSMINGGKSIIFKSESDILPLRSCKLWDIDTKCPHKTSTVISNTFGSDAFEIIKSPFNSEKFNISNPENHNMILPLMSKVLVEKLQYGDRRPILNGQQFSALEAASDKITGDL